MSEQYPPAGSAAHQAILDQGSRRYPGVDTWQHPQQGLPAGTLLVQFDFRKADDVHESKNAVSAYFTDGATLAQHRTADGFVNARGLAETIQVGPFRPFEANVYDKYEYSRNVSVYELTRALRPEQLEVRTPAEFGHGKTHNNLQYGAGAGEQYFLTVEADKLRGGENPLLKLVEVLPCRNQEHQLPWLQQLEQKGFSNAAVETAVARVLQQRVTQMIEQGNPAEQSHGREIIHNIVQRASHAPPDKQFVELNQWASATQQRVAQHEAQRSALAGPPTPLPTPQANEQPRDTFKTNPSQMEQPAAGSQIAATPQAQFKAAATHVAGELRATGQASDALAAARLQEVSRFVERVPYLGGLNKENVEKALSAADKIPTLASSSQLEQLRSASTALGQPGQEQQRVVEGRGASQPERVSSPAQSGPERIAPVVPAGPTPDQARETYLANVGAVVQGLKTHGDGLNAARLQEAARFVERVPYVGGSHKENIDKALSAADKVPGLSGSKELGELRGAVDVMSQAPKLERSAPGPSRESSGIER